MIAGSQGQYNIRWILNEWVCVYMSESVWGRAGMCRKIWEGILQSNFQLIFYIEDSIEVHSCLHNIEVHCTLIVINKWCARLIIIVACV